ncbi:hypothetical protein [Sphingosinicella sp. BN140058]|uniref:hypothetical protein n=1 Tax=Sphingosinicella sp. BN140058 TaxID=1892855 RepID=UPI001012810B|nr:hypothetical protein [Sphingosinicella sp. BN140058]QAY80384.1 hypothetical protein ETR14_27475 [Sphingosinicella sp. BN140058]
MLQHLEQAVAGLRKNATTLKVRLELVALTAEATGDRLLAEQLASDAEDINTVLPQIAKLPLLVPTREAPPQASANPSREERGVFFLYMEALKMLERAQDWERRALQSEPPAPTTPSAVRASVARAQIDIVLDLVLRVRTLYVMSITDAERLVLATGGNYHLQ